MHVLHRCDNTLCVYIEHLFLGTQADNNEDKRRKGRAKSGRTPGESHGMARLDAQQVQVIREMYASGQHPQRAIADLFDVSQKHVSRIVREERWKEGLS
jgi:hypothetical protein